MSDKKAEDKPEFFVSRRGRRVGMHEVDLGGIDIEHQTPEPQPKTALKRSSAPQKPAKAVKASKPVKTVKPRRERRGFMRGHKIALVVIAAIILLPLVAAEMITAEYARGAQQARKDLHQLVTSTVLPAQKKSTISAEQIHGIADKVNGIVGHMCRGGMLDNAAQLYPRAHKAYSSCKTAQSNYASLARNLYELSAEATYLEQAGAVIKPIATPITDEYAVIDAQHTAWRDAADALDKLSPPAAMKSAHSELLSHVKATATAWSTLATANNSQDAAAFQEAEKKLASEYEAVRGTSANFMTVINDTQAKLTASYADLK